MSVNKLNAKQSELKTKNAALFRDIKKAYKEKEKPLSKREITNLIEKRDLVGARKHEKIFEITNLDGISKITLENATPVKTKIEKKTSSEKEKTISTLYKENKAVISAIESRLKTHKYDFFIQEEIFDLLEKLNFYIDDEQTEDIMIVLLERGILSNDEVIESDEEEVEERTPEQIALEEYREMSDKELESEIGDTKDHIK